MPKTIGQLIVKTSAVLAKVVFPIYFDHRGEPEQCGTGFFVRFGPDHFFVSAAHVLDELTNRELFIYVAPGSIRRLSGRALLTPAKAGREKDLVDVGVLKFSGRGTPPYPEVDKFALDISYLRPDLVPRSGSDYMIVGFPASKGHVNPVARQVSSKIYSYRSPSIDDRTYATHGLDPSVHLAMPLNLKRGFDVQGNPRNFPKPSGMSGSPIWLLDGPGEERMFRVVAVGTTYRREKRILIGTDVRVVLNMITELSNRRLQPTASGAMMGRRG